MTNTVSVGKQASAPEDTVGTPLHYTARAGLLAELSRQTYDSLYKALREAILNGIDAGANEVRLDFGREVTRDELLVEDDGEGMNLDALRQSFMSLGGSAKYADATKFGRIGIGSLALLTYAREAVIETKCAGRDDYVKAHLFHPQTLDRTQRAEALDSFPAGLASELPYDGSPNDHFTRLRLVGLNPEVRVAVDDPTSFYDLLDQLRRVLPLPLRNSRLLDVLASQDPDLVDLLRTHTEQWAVPVLVRSPFHDELELSRRTYGDGADEAWSGRLHPIHKTLKIVRAGERRKLVVAGFLASQQRSTAAWSGLTARVQNVAVEERTFFDVTADPGFRKYITGEVFLFGEVDTDRLININRTSFNRESRDYGLVQRFVASEIETFKRSQVAQPQRQKVGVRRLLEDRRHLLDSLDRIAEGADRRQRQNRQRGLPSSRNGSIGRASVVDLVGTLRGKGIDAVIDHEMPGRAYRISAPEQGDRLRVGIGADLAQPSVHIAGVSYALDFRAGRPSGPPVIVRNRPRRIVFNTSHTAVGSSPSPTRAPVVLALELAHLLPDPEENGLYNQLLEFVAAL